MTSFVSSSRIPHGRITGQHSDPTTHNATTAHRLRDGFASSMSPGDRPMALEIMSNTVISGAAIPPTDYPQAPPRQSRSRRKTRQFERREYRLLLIATYPFFFAAALVVWAAERAGLQRSAPLHQMQTGQSPVQASVFTKARAMADSVLPFAFMS
ncbi:MAG: hypothetical protein AAGG72_04185 [Pseudomonadota bacterium]